MVPKKDVVVGGDLQSRDFHFPICPTVSFWLFLPCVYYFFNKNS